MSAEVPTEYVGPSEIHDATITDVRENGSSVVVSVRGYSGERIVLEFTGVSQTRSNRPIAMMLYALLEQSGPGPKRTYTFGNWDEEDDASLEIVADSLSYRIEKQDA